MAASADDLRQELAEHRERISMTVDQIEDRVVPGRVVARGRQRVRDRFVDLRDRVMGHDDDLDDRGGSDWARRGGSSAYASAYGVPTGSAPTMVGRYGSAPRPTTGDGGEGGLVEQGRELVGSAVHGIGEAPRMVRRQTQGAPLAAGLMAFAAGMVVGGIAPPTRREQHLTDRLDPMVGHAVDEARSTAQHVAEELREPVRDAVGEVTEAARTGAGEVKESATRSQRPGGSGSGSGSTSGSGSPASPAPAPPG